jgi:serine/threonine protein kinase
MPGHEIAHYQILAKLGAGGMGVVYLAQDARLGRRVALKVLPTEFARDEDRVARFEREARAVAALSHPGIAVLYEIGEADAVRYLAMEYVEGRSLQEELAAGPLSLDRLIDYTTQIADALEKNLWSVPANTWSARSRSIRSMRWPLPPWGRPMPCVTFTAPIRQTSTTRPAIPSVPLNWITKLENLIPG